ncbi:TonB-linked SusC/RagA family outer membrane protein [Filimonas zeae]|uniref:SusC/RagA family TonB-linked outer membrane protein n=1 Tax=Filimonas zeae TaxID=1737353 RepID=A0A917IVY2_9BACT|nr:SusC/RagA family TonB-linked outer membrane protein [Filimonas zeae]MDR6339059.1 TonB-linked SusC/RagA family outer membrane protein [Filimonas zeae]GGH65299.1 SusC/RagA family TonB-linked outer membrane protein [Filimonas zeae]
MMMRLLERLLCSLAFLLLLQPGYGQSGTLQGTVTDAGGAPLEGATITHKKTGRTTLTNAAGKFILNVSENNAVIQVFYVGYETQELAVKAGENATIKLAASNAALDAVVVVGYGTAKRKDLTGSVASVKGDVIKNQPVTNVTEALQGRTSGVEIIKNSGQPDATPTIIIRGLSSLHQPSPLYIVDGVRVPGDNINIQDIASIDVLKDASAAAIYGSAAAGGVIVITTKKGSGTKPTVNFNARYGITTPKLVHLLNKNEYIRLQNLVQPKYFAGATQTDTLPDTDWVKELYGNATEQNYNLSVSGSSPSVNYLASGFYNAQKGIYIKNYSNIAGARVNTDFKLGDYIKIGEQLAVSQRKTAPPVGSEAQLHNAPFRTLPVIPVRRRDGSWGVVPPGYNGLAFGGPNPVGAAESADAINFKNNFQGNVYAEVKLPLHLTFRTNLGYTYYNETQDYFQGAFNFGTVVNNINSLNKISVVSSQVLTNYVLTYDQTFGKHSLNVIGGYEQITNKFNNINATQSYVGLPGYSFIQTTQSSNTLSGKSDNNGLIKSVFGRLSYNYNNRYYVTGSLRRDANFTVFGPDRQRGTFGAVSAGWNMSEEAFFAPLKNSVNLLKIRGSYGTLGNSAINPYTFAALYTQFFGPNGLGSLSGANFSPGGPLSIGNTVSAIPNPDLHWESIYETNIGVDGEALQGKLYFTVEWYKKTTKDMLYALPVALSSGITQPYFTNIGQVGSKGVDVLVGYRSKAGKLNYDVSVTAGFNANKVDNLSGITTDALFDGYNYYNNGDAGFSIMPNMPLTITRAGLPFGSFYGYKVLGIFKTDAEAQASAQPNAKAGDLIFAHDPKNGNTLSDADRQVIGNPNPKLVYGANVRLNYQGFDMAMLFNGVAGVDIYNGVKAYEMYPWADGNTTSKVFNASFLGSNGLTDQPRIGVKNPDGSLAMDPNKNYTSVNSYFVESGAYVKLKNVQLGYTFANNLLKKASIKTARVFVMANNLFTITSYSGLDPELGSSYSQAAQSGFVGTGAGVTTRGVNAVSQYPQTRIYSVGVDLTF